MFKYYIDNKEFQPLNTGDFTLEWAKGTPPARSWWCSLCPAKKLWVYYRPEYTRTAP